MYKEKRNILLTVFLFLQIFLVRILSGHPEIVERYYSRGIYPFISGISRSLFGWVPFSVGDIFYGLLIFLLLRFIYRLVKKKERMKTVLGFMAACSVLYFLFYALWGLNYSRQPMELNMALNKTDYDLEILKGFTDRMIQRTDSLHGLLSENDSMPVIIPYSKKEIIDKAVLGYDDLEDRFSNYAYSRPSIKKSIFSLPLTYMGFSGYLNPITGEAQVDALIPKIDMPITASHEIAHQLGIASEDEANFLGFLAAYYHQDAYFNYAAHLFALRYALLDIRRADEKLLENYVQRLPKGVIENWRESNDFWKRYENPLEPFFKWFYDNYLKFNRQQDGLKSYNKVLEFLIAYDQIYPLEIN